MSESSGLWLRISPEPSRLFAGFLTLAHILALIGALITAVPMPVRGALVVAILGSWCFYWHKARVEGTSNRALILYGEQEGWRYQIGTKPLVKTDLLASSIATRWIVILHFRTAQNRFQTFVILPDSLDPSNHRRLRMILRICEKKD